ncbi:putative phylloplanin [Helianthus anomalus]
MTSSHHAPYALGDTRATMVGTKGRDLDAEGIPEAWGICDISNRLSYATVPLLCDGNVIASTTTSESGGFSFLVRLQATLTTVLASCKVDVVTPLSACNATLPSTSPSLEASLRATIQSSVTTSKIITSPFQVMGSL